MSSPLKDTIREIIFEEYKGTASLDELFEKAFSFCEDRKFVSVQAVRTEMWELTSIHNQNNI